MSSNFDNEFWYDSDDDYMNDMRNDMYEAFDDNVRIVHSELNGSANLTLWNAKNRVLQNLQKNKAMTDDIKSGMAKTNKTGYGHISEADRRTERQTTLSVQDMKKAKEDLVK